MVNQRKNVSRFSIYFDTIASLGSSLIESPSIGLANHLALTKLKAWIDTHVTTATEFENSKVVFGPNLSFFARSGDDTIWHNLPPDLEAQIISKGSQDPPVKPSLVTLGINGAWAAIWSDGSDSWHLATHYTKLELFLSKEGRAPITVSFIHPE